MDRRFASALLASALAACVATPENPPLVSPPKGAAVTRQPLETPAIPPVAIAPPAYPVPAPAPSKIIVPPNTQYVCVVDAKGKQQQTAIEFAPRVAALCRKHPEMGPCQYERNNCRASGGRVFAADGVEITMATEAEYDKKVMRVRFRAN
ncbi:MAG TPA: hypothetical protein VGL25_18125 [Casimicrobiaceae bacterium]|jgi:hypothetical protein